jgi:hypothetical protein
VVGIGEVGGADVPCLVERIELTAANADPRVAGLDAITRMAADHERADRPHRPRRDVLADRYYTSEVGRADDWIWPLFGLGFDSVHALTENQLGQGRRPLSNGAIVVDGQPYSPRLPQHLRNLTPPKVGAPKSAITAYQEQVALRAPYALHAVGGRQDDGSWDLGCRAMSLLGSLRCDLKPASMAKLPTRAGRRPTRRCSPRGGCRRSAASRSPGCRWTSCRSGSHSPTDRSPGTTASTGGTASRGPSATSRTTPRRTSPAVASGSWEWPGSV